MAKRTRRVTARRKSSSPSWRKILVVLFPVLAVAFLLTNNLGYPSVLGESDSREDGRSGLFSFLKSEPSKSPKPSGMPGSCNRVTSFSASTICERSTKEKTNNSFQTYTYTCEDGTSGTVALPEISKAVPSGYNTKCVPIEKAYEAARKLCHKKCRPSLTPTAKPTEGWEVPQ